MAEEGAKVVSGEESFRSSPTEHSTGIKPQTINLDRKHVQPDLIDEILGSACFDENSGLTEVVPEKEEKSKKMPHIKSEPPIMCPKFNAIIPAGKFARYKRKTFYSNRFSKPTEAKLHSDSVQDTYWIGAGTVFTSRAHANFQLEQRDTAVSTSTCPPYEYREFLTRRSHVQHKISNSPVTSKEDLNNSLRRSPHNFEEKNPNAFLNKHYEAIPEELIWKAIGQHRESIPFHFICPSSRNIKHYAFEKSVVEAEKYRVNLIYELICREGIKHIEDLWRVYLRYLTSTKVYHAFDGYTHFSRFIGDRSHIFGMDLHHMVYNQNMVVTVAVLRYVHALFHGTSILDAPKLFKKFGASLFYRAFLSFMSSDDLSLDLFFRNFPTLFAFDETNMSWNLHISSVSSIPSAFLPQCLPKRNHTHTYVDRSILFNGVGKVIANNIMKIKILSEETLRSDMEYIVGVPREIIEDPHGYPVGTRVAYTGVRIYNGDKESVEGRSIEILPNEDPVGYDGTVDVFTLEEGNENKASIVETHCGNEERISRVRDELAYREKDKKRAIEIGMEEETTIEICLLFNKIAKNFKNDFNDFCIFIESRPFYYQLEENDGKVFLSARPLNVSKKMIHVLVLLGIGKEGRSFCKEEA